VNNTIRTEVTISRIISYVLIFSQTRSQLTSVTNGQSLLTVTIGSELLQYKHFLCVLKAG